jgi:hypothetical protein
MKAAHLPEMEALMGPVEREYGPLERSIREKYQEGDPLTELAAKLAFILDVGEGSAAVAKELRTLLATLKPRASEAARHVARMERAHQGKWAMMREGTWKWADGDWVRVDDDEAD